MSEPALVAAPELPPDDDPTVGAVAVAYVFPDDGEVDHNWVASMFGLLGLDFAHEGRVWRGGLIAMQCGTSGLIDCRNRAVATFLEDRKAEWFFWLDTDMGFGPEALEQLLAVADPVERPVVGALAFSFRQLGTDGLNGWRCSPSPTVFDWRAIGKEAGFASRSGYTRNAVTQVKGTGAACILIHRSVLEKVAERYGPHWYDPLPNLSMGQMTSEDLSFCMRLGQLEIPIYVHTGVQTNHAKRVWVNEEMYLAERLPPPATAPTAVIVPVLRRPQNAAPFMASLRATTGLATVYAVADADDQPTIDAWESAGAVVLHAKPEHWNVGSFAEKVNLGYRETSEPWLFLVGDDVRFWPGWLDHAQAQIDEKTHVVGTNDLLSPRVQAGEHATHMLIRRSYVDEMGASWDGPGVVAHEGYRHWYVDDELVTAAKARGVWAPASLSRVEHLHPIGGKAPDDEVYELGASAQNEDRELFTRRAAANL